MAYVIALLVVLLGGAGMLGLGLYLWQMLPWWGVCLFIAFVLLLIFGGIDPD